MYYMDPVKEKLKNNHVLTRDADTHNYYFAARESTRTPEC